MSETRIREVRCDACDSLVKKEINGKVVVDKEHNNIEIVNNCNIKRGITLCDNCTDEFKMRINTLLTEG